MYSFNLYDWYANFRDFSKTWQMKLKLWHLILQKIVKVSSGQKNQTFCQIYMKKSFLSLPITFSVLVNVFPYQIFIQNTQITVFNFFSTKFGALPILQECPHSVDQCICSYFPQQYFILFLTWPIVLIFWEWVEIAAMPESSAFSSWNSLQRFHWKNTLSSFNFFLYSLRHWGYVCFIFVRITFVKRQRYKHLP